MADVDLDLRGIELIEEQLKELEDNIDNPITWYTGTGVPKTKLFSVWDHKFVYGPAR